MAGKVTKLEFAVKMTCQGCADAVKKALTSVPEIHDIIIDLLNEQVVVETTLTCDRIQDLIESTGRKAVLRGMGLEKNSQSSGSAAVAIVTGKSGQQGVIRLVQSDDGPCLFDGTVDGLATGTHIICIHEFGDLSEGCDSCGEIFEFHEDFSDPLQKYGELGSVEVDEHGRAEFRIENPRINISEIIGRAVVVHQKVNADTTAKYIRVACGIVARSSGIFENTKRLCACDGNTLWDERELQQKQKSKHQRK